MSKSKHQTLKSIMDGQSKREIDLMFAEKDHDAMELVEKRNIKKEAPAIDGALRKARINIRVEVR